MRFFIYALAMMGLIIPMHASAIEVGSMAPDIVTQDIHGNDFKLSDHKGKIVVLEWHNPECPYVLKHYDTGNMQKVQTEVTAMDGVAWVSINSSAEGKQGAFSADDVKAYLEKEGAKPTAYLLDPTGVFGKAYDAKTTPHMYVIDADGRVAYAGAIDDNSSPRQSTVEGATNYVLAAVNDLKAGKVVATASTRPYGCSVKY